MSDDATWGIVWLAGGKLGRLNLEAAGSMITV